MAVECGMFLRPTSGDTTAPVAVADRPEHNLPDGKPCHAYG